MQFPHEKRHRLECSVGLGPLWVGRDCDVARNEAETFAAVGVQPNRGGSTPESLDFELGQELQNRGGVLIGRPEHV